MSILSFNKQPQITPPPVEITVQDEGTPIVSTSIFNFVGSGVTVTNDPAGTAKITISDGQITVQDEGTPIVSTSILNFVGSGVTVTNDPAGTAKITIPQSPITVQDEGTPIVSPFILNFVGSGVTVTNDPAGTAKITTQSQITVQDKGTPIVSTSILNFVGDLVTVTNDPAGTAKANINLRFWDEYSDLGTSIIWIPKGSATNIRAKITPKGNAGLEFYSGSNASGTFSLANGGTASGATSYSNGGTASGGNSQQFGGGGGQATANFTVVITSGPGQASIYRAQARGFKPNSNNVGGDAYGHDIQDDNYNTALGEFQTGYVSKYFRKIMSSGGTARFSDWNNLLFTGYTTTQNQKIISGYVQIMVVVQTAGAGVLVAGDFWCVFMHLTAQKVGGNINIVNATVLDTHNTANMATCAVTWGTGIPSILGTFLAPTTANNTTFRGNCHFMLQEMGY